jgi:hypothetical protein
MYGASGDQTRKKEKRTRSGKVPPRKRNRRKRMRNDCGIYCTLVQALRKDNHLREKGNELKITLTLEK